MKYVKDFLNKLNSSENKHKNKIVAFVLRKSKDYDVDYLEKILSSLRENISVEVEYVCLSDIDVSSYCTWIKFQHDWPGWWSKLELFSHPYLRGREVVYFDLDTVIQGDITPLIEYDHNFSMLRDFLFDHRYGSGVMAWKGDRSYITNNFKIDIHPKTYVTSENWGDQAFIRDNVNEKIEVLQDLLPDKVKICSYKSSRHRIKNKKEYHIVCFHGKPRPREVQWRV